MRSLEELGGYDRIRRGHEFTRAVLHYAAAKGRMGDALAFAEQSRAPQRVTEYLKAAVGAGAIDVGSPSPWGGPLASFSVLQEGFFAALASQSAFFRMLEDGALTRLPPNTRAGFLTADATAYAVGLGKPVPLSRLDIASTTIVNQRVASLIVVTEEVLQSSASGAEAAFGRSLRAGVAAVVDSTFLSTIARALRRSPRPPIPWLTCAAC